MAFSYSDHIRIRKKGRSDEICKGEMIFEQMGLDVIRYGAR